MSDSEPCVRDIPKNIFSAIADAFREQGTYGDCAECLRYYHWRADDVLSRWTDTLWLATRFTVALAVFMLALILLSVVAMLPFFAASYVR